MVRVAVRDALEDGIGAAQIVSFLETNAHPQAVARAAAGRSVVPATVAEQLALWEADRNRVTARKGVLHDFGPHLDLRRFAALAAELDGEGLLLWQDPANRRLVVHPGPQADARIERA